MRFQHGFEAGFSRVREGYRNVLAMALENRTLFIAGFLGFVVLSFGLAPFLGSNFFPSIDSGEMTLHVRAPVGTRLEDTAALFDHVEQAVRQTVPPAQLSSIVDNIGLPVSGINRAYSNTGGIGPQDGDIYITLTKSHRPTAQYVRQLRERLPRLFPGSTFSFLPADIISQILNFGAPAPIDIQVAGPNRDQNEAYADELLRRLRAIPGVADARMQQSSHYPQFKVAVDRTRADQLGITERDVDQHPGHHPGRQLPDGSGFLAQPEERRLLPDRRSEPAVRRQTLSRLAEYTGDGREPGDMQVLGGLGDGQSRERRRGRVALCDPAVVRPLRHHPGQGSGRGRPRHPATDQRHLERSAQGRHHHLERPGHHHEQRLLGPIPGSDRRGRCSSIC